MPVRNVTIDSWGVGHSAKDLYRKVAVNLLFVAVGSVISNYPWTLLVKVEGLRSMLLGRLRTIVPLGNPKILERTQPKMNYIKACV